MADPFQPMMDELNGGLNARSKAFERANRHSRFVKLLKFLLPLSALAIIIGFSFVAIQARLGSELGVSDISLERGRIVMDSPTLNGMTGDNNPYSMRATRALQLATNVNDIELEGITAQFPFGTGATADIQAPFGHLNNAVQVLTLRGGFNMTTSDGLVAKLQDAEVDFGKRSLKTDRPVDIKRPGTHIVSDSLVVTDGGAKLVFEKRVRMTLQPDLLRPKEPANGG